MVSASAEGTYRVDECGPQSPANLGLACARPKHFEAPLVSTLGSASMVRASECVPLNTSNLMWHSAVPAHKDEDSLSAVLSQSAALTQDLNAQQLANTV